MIDSKYGSQRLPPKYIKKYPLFTLKIQVAGECVPLSVFEGDSPFSIADRFCNLDGWEGECIELITHKIIDVLRKYSEDKCIDEEQRIKLGKILKQQSNNYAFKSEVNEQYSQLPSSISNQKQVSSYQSQDSCKQQFENQMNNYNNNYGNNVSECNTKRIDICNQSKNHHVDSDFSRNTKSIQEDNLVNAKSEQFKEERFSQDGYQQQKKSSKQLSGLSLERRESLYERGVNYLGQKNEKIRQKIEEKKEEQIKCCTFIPKINSKKNQKILDHKRRLSFDACNQLYLSGKASLAQREIKKEQAAKEQMKICPFYPQVNPVSKSIVVLNQSFEKKRAKSAEEKKKKTQNEMNKECTFHPKMISQLGRKKSQELDFGIGIEENSQTWKQNKDILHLSNNKLRSNMINRKSYDGMQSSCVMKENTQASQLSHQKKTFDLTSSKEYINRLLFEKSALSQLEKDIQFTGKNILNSRINNYNN